LVDPALGSPIFKSAPTCTVHPNHGNAKMVVIPCDLVAAVRLAVVPVLAGRRQGYMCALSRELTSLYVGAGFSLPQP
jgi:hypothetical protein